MMTLWMPKVAMIVSGVALDTIRSGGAMVTIRSLVVAVTIFWRVVRVLIVLSLTVGLILAMTRFLISVIKTVFITITSSLISKTRQAVLTFVKGHLACS